MDLPKSYKIVNRMDGGQRVFSAEMTCAKCNKSASHATPSSTNRNVVVKLFARDGWQCDLENPRFNRCPDCLRKAKEEKAANKPAPAKDDVVVQRANGHHHEKPPPRPTYTPPPAKPSPGTVITESFTPPPEPEPQEPAMNASAPIPMPTPVQRDRIRDLLDSHFDTENGHYNNGWSDEKIGRDAGIGYAAVARIREVAYGPIKSDPETAAIRKELDELRNQLESFVNGASQIEVKLGPLENRLRKIEAKYIP